MARPRNIRMPFDGRLPRLGLLARFSVLSFLAFVLIGVVLGRTLTDQIRERSLAAAGESAELVTHFGIQPQLSSFDVQEGLAQEAIDSLDSLLHAGYTSDSVLTIRIWNRDNRVVYSDEAGVIGKVAHPEEPLREALAGRTAVRDVEGHAEPGMMDGRKSIEAFVPLRFEGERKPVGAFEVHLEYEPVAAAIERDTRRLYAVLIVGLLALYGALFRIVSGASRRLRRQAAENEYQAHHDALTGLPNRSSFYDRVDRAITRAAVGEEMAAVMLVDLDRFKEVNDTLGHHSGDVLLRAGRRAAEARRCAPGDTLARLGGDEFAVLLPRVPGHDGAIAVAARIRDALERPFVRPRRSRCDIEASIGIAIFPEHGDDAESLLQRADVAMYAAKRSRSSFEIYAAGGGRSTARPAAAARRAARGDRQRRARPPLPAQGRASATGAVDGVEALVRWEHPERGLVPPDDFIPLAEQTGLITPLTAWVLDAALPSAAAGATTGSTLGVAVNLSARNLLDTTCPIDRRDARRSGSCPPRRSSSRSPRARSSPTRCARIDVLGRLDGMGIGLAIDDFGTGYSSLAYLKDLPVRELKIDRTFVNNMDVDGSDAFIVRSTIDLARNLGLQVVAEGVETAATLDQLAALGCDLAQGYYLSRPLPADELAQWLRRRSMTAVEGIPAAQANQA